ncbi:hypothetical protein CCY99_01685 [Helicobacter sp. 16-1353]|uniref:ABC transporter permease n=1 Tax=Helicobacter sp. 16-1353 TaxID=2004996 RepID=UPI000DCD96C1|nr:ABC transporter permease [Helicobacter sp. 16-1353]RAX54883.1 hypothetical protein CCY99_01685 [Helicobacter sp. 16-1353]
MKLRILSFIIFIAIIFLWEILLDSTSFLPRPSDVWAAFLELLNNGILIQSILDSLRRFAIGLFIGGGVATFVGLILGRFTSFEIVLEPYIQLLRPISPIAWLPILALLFGIGEVGAIFVIIYAVFFPVLLLSIAGVRAINPTLLQMAKNFGASEWLIFKSIILPGAFAHIASGLKLAASIAWIHLVAGEMLGIQSGLGYLIIDGRNTLRMDIVVVAMSWIGILGYGIHLVFVRLERFIRSKLGESK